MKRELDQNLSGNEVYCTNSLISLVKNMLCGKLHCKKGLNLILCQYEMRSRTSQSCASCVRGWVSAFRVYLAQWIN